MCSEVDVAGIGEVACPRHGLERGHPRPGGCCRVPDPRVRSFLQPQLLMSLLKKPAHGYELMERLAGEGSTAVDPGLLYRTLRQLEEEGLVRSAWNTDGVGPARRLYEATPEGEDYLRAWTVNIRQIRDQMDHFLAEYETGFGNAGANGTGNTAGTTGTRKSKDAGGDQDHG
jgi:PadR family transcriptional regulator, regulatory protein PadR